MERCNTLGAMSPGKALSMIGTNGSAKAKSSRTNWNVTLKVNGWGDEVMERSPVLGTRNVRVRPKNPRNALLAYFTTHPEIVQEFSQTNGLDLTPEEMSDRSMLESFLGDLFALLCLKLDRVEGHAGQAPSVDYFSFRVPVSDQISITRPSGIGSLTGPIQAPTSKDELAAKIAAQRARIAAARSATSNQPTQPDSQDTPMVDNGTIGEKRRGGKKA